MNENAQRIHDDSIKLLEKVGMKFLHPDAQKVLAEHGVRLEGDVAYFTEDQVMEWVGKAPATAHIYARDPRFDMELGSGTTYLGPSMGGVWIVEPDGSTRAPKLPDLIKADKIVESNDRYSINGGGICTITDVPAEHLMYAQVYTGLMLSGKVPPDFCGSYETVEACYDLLAASFGCTKEELAERPRILSGVNVNSPLWLDYDMTETLFTALKYRQPCYIAPASMAGTTSPVTVAGTIVQTNAEVIATIALAQMYAPGAPVVYASQSASADMQSLAIATGSPESALCYRYAGIMGRFYHIPVRAGGLMTDAKRLDAQAGYESMLTYLACRQNDVDVVLQGAGFTDAYLGFSFEKMISDFEVVDFADRYCEDIVVDDETVPFETMAEVGHDGSFMMSEHTLENCREALLVPRVSTRGSKGPHAFEAAIASQVDAAVASYQAPQIDAACIDRMGSLLMGLGFEESFVRTVEEARSMDRATALVG